MVRGKAPGEDILRQESSRFDRQPSADRILGFEGRRRGRKYIQKHYPKGFSLGKDIDFVSCNEYR